MLLQYRFPRILSVSCLSVSVFRATWVSKDTVGAPVSRGVIVFVSVSLLSSFCGVQSGELFRKPHVFEFLLIAEWEVKAQDGLVIGKYGDNWDYKGEASRGFTGSLELEVVVFQGVCVCVRVCVCVCVCVCVRVSVCVHVVLFM